MTRKQYYVKVWIYLQRREKYKLTYKGNIPVYKTDQYKRLSTKIGQWRKEIKRLDKRKEKIKKVFRAINRYFNVRIQDRNTNEKTNLARKIYFKIGLETVRIHGAHFARFIGRDDQSAAWSRATLTESFKTSKHNKEQFHNFKTFFEQHTKEVDE